MSMIKRYMEATHIYIKYVDNYDVTYVRIYDRDYDSHIFTEKLLRKGLSCYVVLHNGYEMCESMYDEHIRFIFNNFKVLSFKFK